MNTTKIKFSEYFNNWLYGKDGYYVNYKTIGKEGDFFTAVSTSSFFGGTIGKKIVDTIKNENLPKDTTIVEIGAHHGYLLADIIQFIYTLDAKLLKTLTFAIVERFDSLQKQQAKYLKESFGDEIKLVFYNDIKELQLDNSFVIANEIFDAFSCELVYTNNKNILQQGFVENHKISFEDCKDKKLLEHCKEFNITKGEVGVGYEEFVNILTNNIKNYEFITFDYGDRVPRNDFSTRIYKKHEVFPIFDENIQLTELYKKADITYDVDFSHLMTCFKKANVKDIVFKTQLQALVEFGIIDLLEILKANSDENTYLRETQKVKVLLEPTGMGDRFKMLYIKK